MVNHLLTNLFDKLLEVNIVLIFSGGVYVLAFKNRIYGVSFSSGVASLSFGRYMIGIDAQKGLRRSFIFVYDFEQGDDIWRSK